MQNLSLSSRFMYYSGLLVAMKGSGIVDDLNHISNLLDAEENGELIRLPIAIGKPVYVLEKCCCGLHYDCRTNKKANAKRKAIEIVEVKKDRMHNCVKIFERPFRVEYLNRIGKTVFETLEEAKAAVEKKEV